MHALGPEPGHAFTDGTKWHMVFNHDTKTPRHQEDDFRQPATELEIFDGDRGRLWMSTAELRLVDVTLRMESWNPDS